MRDRVLTAARATGRDPAEQAERLAREVLPTVRAAAQGGASA
jgi:hypothetical protein